METSAHTLEKRYKAFISYSHADNQAQGRKWADWLHHTLETYPIPAELIGKTNQYGQKIPAQIYPVFQDEKELSANANLSASLQSALDRAEFLVYLSSPHSARSLYVQEEIRHFKKTGKGQRIIALILRGEPEYGETQTERQCFPDVLRFGVDAEGNILYQQREEALAADVRLPHSTEEGFTSAAAYRHYLQEQKLPAKQIKQNIEEYQERLNLAKLKIIAGILGVPLNELTQRDQAYELERVKRKNRIIKWVTSAISALAILAGISGIYAWNQKNEAQKNLAQSLYASGINKLAQNEYGDPAAYIAAAVRNGSDNAILFAESMLAIKNDMVLLPNILAANAVFSPDGRYVAGLAGTGTNHFELQLWDARTRHRLADIEKITARRAYKPVFDGNNDLYAMNDQNEIIRYQIGTRKTNVVYRQAGSGDFTLMGVSPNGRWLAVRQFNPETLTLVANGKDQARLNLPAPHDAIIHILFSPDSTTALMLFSHADRSDGQIFYLEDDRPETRIPFELPKKISGADFSPDGKYILFSANTANANRYTILDRQNGRSRPLQTQDRLYDRVTFNPDSASIVAISDQGYDLYDSRTGERQASHALPLADLRRVLWKNDADLSPDQTQRIVTLNKQTYLQNIGGRNLLINEQHIAPDARQVLADAKGAHWLILQADGKTLSRIDIESGARQPEFILLPEETAYLRILENNLLMAVSRQKTVRFFDADTAQAVGKATPTQARRILLKRDHSQFLARTGDNGFAIWNVRDGAEIMRYSQPKPLENFIADSNFERLLVASKEGWTLSDLTGKKILLEGKGSLSNAAFSPDGRWLALGYSEGRADVYDLEHFKKHFSLPTIASPILLFSHDGKTLLASENTRRLHFWHTRDRRAYGQTVPVSPYTKLLDFSADNRKLFLQDNTDETLAPAIKIIDTSSGNLISLPFAAGMYDSIQLLDADNRIATVQKLPEGYQVQIWQTPGQQRIAPEQIAEDLEAFYGRQYDPQTGTINDYKGKKPFNTWYSQDIYTRPVAPDARTTVIQVIERMLPIENTDSLQLLASAYFYHPLARAGLAEYFNRQPQADALSAELARLTRLQLAGLENAQLKAQTEAILSRLAQTPPPANSENTGQ